MTTSSQRVEGWSDLSDDEIEALRTKCYNTSLPMLLGTDSYNKWHVHSGKEKETGVISYCHIKEYGTVWKVECIVDCAAEKFFTATTVDFDIDWVPHLDKLQHLTEQDDFNVLHQVTRGVPCVADRDFVTIQFQGKTCIKSQDEYQSEHTVHYSLCCSVPDEHFDKSLFPDCVRGEYFPGGWAWQHVSDNKCLFTFIYNLDIKGYLPKKLVSWAASGFLVRFIKAVQEQAVLVASNKSKSRHIVPPTPSTATTTSRHHRHHRH